MPRPSAPRRSRRTDEDFGACRQLDEDGHDVAHDAVLARNDSLAEVADAAQAGGSSTWTPWAAGRLTGLSGWNPSLTRSSAT